MWNAVDLTKDRIHAVSHTAHLVRAAVQEQCLGGSLNNGSPGKPVARARALDLCDDDRMAICNAMPGSPSRQRQYTFRIWASNKGP
jgi:hypothetical protein